MGSRAAAAAAAAEEVEEEEEEEELATLKGVGVEGTGEEEEEPIVQYCCLVYVVWRKWCYRSQTRMRVTAGSWLGTLMWTSRCSF